MSSSQMTSRFIKKQPKRRQHCGTIFSGSFGTESVGETEDESGSKLPRRQPTAYLPRREGVLAWNTHLASLKPRRQPESEKLKHQIWRQ